MSSVSIVRWFLKTTTLNPQSRMYARSTFCYGYYNFNKHKTFRISGNVILDYGVYDNILTMCESYYSWKEFIVHDISEFLDTDDISLVLRYGRNILDENIIRSINFRNIKISMDDMMEIMNDIRN